MSTFVEYAASFSTGVLLGLFFLQGLWLTLQHIEKSPHPALRLLFSTVIRFVIVLGSFYLIARYAGWQHVMAAVLGFTVLRFYLVRRLAATRKMQREGEEN